jgi:hypothetical protein
MTWDGTPVLTYASLSVRQILICICQGHCRRLSWRCGNGIYTSQEGKKHLVHLEHRDVQEYRERKPIASQTEEDCVKDTMKSDVFIAFVLRTQFLNG